MAYLSCALLGSVEIARDGEPVTGFATDKVRALLVYLVVEAGRSHRRDELAELLWPEQPAQAGRNSLRQALAILRQALGDACADPPFLVITRDWVQCNPAAEVRLDVAEFTALLAACEQHAHTRLEGCTPCAQRLEQAVSLYRGNFLHDITVRDSTAFEEWVLLKRERLRQQATDTLCHLAAYSERRGAYVAVQRYAWRQVELDSWSEEAHRQLMRGLAGSGQPNGALRQYVSLRRTLRQELGVEPAPETVALAEQIRARTLFVPHPPRPAHSVPTPPSSFVGRESETIMVASRLTDRRCRLLTLLGPPGIGKTRLALHVAAQVALDFDDGVAFVPLAPVADPDLVASTIAGVLGVTERDARPLVERLKEYLDSHQLLLVLDNFEHVLGAAPLLAELLAAPHITILVTSRVRLHLSGEQTFVVPPLAVPDRSSLPVGGVASQYAGIELFMQRAQMTNPSFQITPANVAAVAAICAHLDGIPLAIELAAARTRLLSPVALFARLGNRLALLTGGARDTPARHQTLRNTLDWSYKLLDVDGQTLLRRLAVFAGGCTLGAAEVVCGMQRDPRLEILNGLQSLVDSSLINQEQGPDDEPRFTMLETIREYASEKFAASHEAQALRERHLAFFLRLAEAGAGGLRGNAQLCWLKRLDTEHDNLRAALEYALMKEDGTEASLQLAVALSPFWEVRGQYAEGRRWLEQALVHGSEAPVTWQARALMAAGVLALAQNDRENARAALEQSARLARGAGDKQTLAHALIWRAAQADHEGDIAAQTLYAEESITLCREVEDTWGLALALAYLGWASLEQGDHGRARALFEESVALFRDLGDQRSLRVPLNGLGAIAHAQGDYVTARARYEESLALARIQSDKASIEATLPKLGHAACLQSDYATATACYGAARAIQLELGIRDGPTAMLHALGWVAYQQGDYPRATTLCAESLALSRASGDKQSEGMALRNLGYIAHLEGNRDRANTLFKESLGVLRELGNMLPYAPILVGVACVVAELGEPERAARLFGSAESVLGHLEARLAPADRAIYQQSVGVARIELGERRFAEAWAEGQALTLEQAVAYALDSAATFP